MYNFGQSKQFHSSSFCVLILISHFKFSFRIINTDLLIIDSVNFNKLVV